MLENKKINNKILMDHESLRLLKKILETFSIIRYALNRQHMTASDVYRRLKITRMQLSYWGFKKGMRLTRKKTPGRSWRRFSILDLFGFAILKELRKFGLGLDLCRKVINLLRGYFYVDYFFVHHFAEGDPITLVVDVDAKGVMFLYGSVHPETKLKVYNRMQEGIVLLSLTPIFKEILRSIKKEDFFVEFVRDKFGQQNKIIFYIDDNQIEFKLTEEEFKKIYDIASALSHSKKEK
jgi:hypothetical protein